MEFSEKSQAGYGTRTYSGVDAFSKLNFDYIYDNTFENFDTTKQYRHAEIVHQNSLAIESCISNILCRNNLERTTLLNLLKEENPLAFAKYKNIIKVYKRDTFENNGLFISDCSYHSNKVSITFSDTYNGKRYFTKFGYQPSVKSNHIIIGLGKPMQTTKDTDTSYQLVFMEE
mgnify:CR=1 FL=1